MKKRVLTYFKSKPGNNLFAGISLFAVSLISIISWRVSYLKGLTVTYNDAMSHLNLSRLIIDNQEPGLSQLGGVWLPLNHVLSLLLVWNDWAWHSGFAGSIFSMLAYVVSVWAIYKIVKEITNNRLASVVGSIAFALNLNILYLQTTPLTEPLYIAVFVLSVLFLTKWIKEDKAGYLPIIGFFGFLQVLTRYDGWFVVGIEGLVILLHQLVYRRESLNNSLGKTLLFVLPVAFGIGIWLLWNYLIFNDLLFFALGPYSARAQQTTIETVASLITKGDIFTSLLAYWFAILSNVGTYVTLLGLTGLVAFLFKQGKLKLTQRLLVVFLLVSPIMFYVLSLYFGFAILNLPQLNWNPSPEPAGQWFNVRYGILALPAIAIFIGLLSNTKKVALAAVIIILFQVSFTYSQGVITIIDGTIGSGAFVNNDISRELEMLVAPDEKVLLSASSFSSVAFKSNQQLKQFVHEGVSKQWSYAIVTPEDYVKWIVMANGDVGEPIYTSLVKERQGEFLSFYKLVYKGEHANIYKIKDLNELFVKRQGNDLLVGKEIYKIVGVNSYDLAYLTEKEIEERFQLLNSEGVNTVRFWLFGDGFEEGFQPESGIFNEERFKKLDFIIARARKHNIRLIPVFVKNWGDYGGKSQYLKWLGKDPVKEEGLFYTDPEVISLFKNYINKVVSRYNNLTNSSYANEPSILAWDIMNEPRLENSNIEIVNKWVGDVASYIKSIDSNHLVMVGAGRVDAEPESNQANLVCKYSSIDICSLYLYLYDDEIPIFENKQEIYRLLEKQFRFATEEGKPLLLEVFGIPKDRWPFESDPLGVMKNITERQGQTSIRGSLSGIRHLLIVTPF